MKNFAGRNLPQLEAVRRRTIRAYGAGELSQQRADRYDELLQELLEMSKEDDNGEA